VKEEAPQFQWTEVDTDLLGAQAVMANSAPTYSLSRTT
jgi:hypothetical protein